MIEQKLAIGNYVAKGRFAALLKNTRDFLSDLGSAAMPSLSSIVTMMKARLW
jgi:hypothetical protein